MDRHQKQITAQQLSLMDLPSDLMARILSLADFTARVHCQQVCSYWSTLLSSPQVCPLKLQPETALYHTVQSKATGLCFSVSMSEYTGSSQFVASIAL